jgi:hypothetical protein
MVSFATNVTSLYTRRFLVDFSKFKTHDWLMVGGGIAMLIFGAAFDWLTSDFASGANAFDFFFTGTIPWILIVGTGVVAALLALDVIKSDSAPWPLILLAATAVSLLLLLLRIIFNPGVPDGIDRGTGMYLAFVAAIVATAGAYMNFTAAGGNLNDLKDMDKLKSSFGSGKSDSELPPPPPPPAPPTPPQA